VRVLFLTAEAAPLAKVGGLGDVGGALPKALRALGHDVRVALPFYGVIDRERFGPALVARVTVPHVAGEQTARVSVVTHEEVTYYLIAGPPIPRARRVYGKDSSEDGPKFIFYSLAALGLCRVLDWAPEVVHANDAHAGPAVYWLAVDGVHDPLFSRTGSVFTIHNLMYMSARAGRAMLTYGLAPSDDPLLPDWARDSLMGLGLAHADVLNTVSPTHAKEILTPALGYGFEGLLRARQTEGRLTGILNGLDLAAWDPAADKALAARFDAERLARRAMNKRRLQRDLALPAAPRAPLLAMISRLDTQKGLEIALPALRTLLNEELEAQAILLGTGLPALEQETAALAREFPRQARAALRFDGRLARQLYGGADMVLVPSLYEPCGLAQMIALRYGAVPVVRQTGGLADTVVDAAQARQGNGFVFSDYNAGALLEALKRALRVYRRPARWQALQRRGSRQALRLGWERSAEAYAALYQQAISRRKEALERRAAAWADMPEAG
jgi:starch synthase